VARRSARRASSGQVSTAEACQVVLDYMQNSNITLTNAVVKIENVTAETFKNTAMLKHAAAQVSISDLQARVANDQIVQGKVLVAQAQAAIAAKNREIEDHDSFGGQVSDYFKGMKSIVDFFHDDTKSAVGTSILVEAGDTTVSTGGLLGLGTTTSIFAGIGAFWVASYITLQSMSSAQEGRMSERTALETQNLPAAQAQLDIAQRALQIATLNQGGGWAIELQMFYLLGGVIIVVLLAVIGLEMFSRRSRRRVRSDLAFARGQQALAMLHPIARGMQRGQTVLHRPRTAAGALAAGLASWAAQIGGIYAALAAADIQPSIGMAGLVFLVSTLVQLFPFWPGNIGLFQAAVAQVLVQAYPIDFPHAIAFAVGLQVIEVSLGVGIGFWCLAREGLSLSEVRGLRGDD
jgi:hypothetical protein